MVRVVLRDEFYHDGRGPELQAMHVTPRGSDLVAIDYYLPDAVYGPEAMRHLRFVKPQVYMVTPEEVENYAAEDVKWRETGGGAVVSLGRSSWLDSFNQRHLARCEHFRIMFYDQFVDVICEGVEAKTGPYRRA